MKVSTYLSFNGDCEAAFRLYERCLGGRIEGLFRYAGSPMAGEVPPEWGNKIMHGSITIGGQLVQGDDVAPGKYQKPQGVSMAVHPTAVADGERIFRELGEGGTVVMPFGKTFWAAGFGVVVDRFGIQWIINCDEVKA